jgi:hypothetical protein
MDNLYEMFSKRQEFMEALVSKIPDYYPKWPLDPTKKENQLIVKDAIFRGVEEIFEALQHLKNSKPHRLTEVPDFNREQFLEEIVDSMNFFFTPLVLLGFTPEEFFEAYKKKHETIMKRLEEGY